MPSLQKGRVPTKTKTRYVSHPLLRPNTVLYREYQDSMSQVASHQNTLIVIPTSLGKTIIALLALVRILDKNPHGRIMVLAPTRPLVMQHWKTFQEFLVEDIKCCLFSSNLSPIQRTYALNDHHIFFSTPQIIQNDVKGGLYSLEGFAQIIFDETHKARKKYAYTFVAQAYLRQCGHPKILGLTASPGNDLFRINELCETLQIERIAFRERESRDIQKYVQPISTIIHRIELPPEVTQAQAILDTAIRKVTNYLRDQEILPKRNYTSKFQFIQLMQDMKTLEFLLDPHQDYTDLYDVPQDSPEAALNYPHLYNLFNPRVNDKIPPKNATLSKAINGIYLEHLKEILTTQDVRMFWNYLDKLYHRAKKGNRRVQRFINSKYIKGIKKILDPHFTSPKIPQLIRIIEEELETDPDGKFIVFTQYREMGTYLINELNGHVDLRNQNVKAQRFVGQASHDQDKGLSQKQQSAMIEAFSQGNFNVLVATSVAEEGLDIPNVNAVIFYDMVPSEIRLIQRRGRTGRHQPGRCHCLVNENTLDTIYNQVSHRKEAKMHQLLQNPQLVNTVDQVERTDQKPEYQIKSLSEIKHNYDQMKMRKAEQAMEDIEDKIARHDLKSANKRVPASIRKEFNQAADLVNDYTKKLTRSAQVQSQHIHRQKQSKKQDGLRYLTKWIYEWIFSTVEIIGSRAHNSLYCDLDDLYQAAHEEEIDPLKIQKEIDKGLKYQVFQTRNAQLIIPLS